MEKKIPVDFILISATSKNIKEEIKMTSLELTYITESPRLRLEIPSLKKEKEDIDHLSRLFIKEFCTEMKMESKRLNAEAIKTLSQHNWPGNIRELSSVIKNF